MITTNYTATVKSTDDSYWFSVCADTDDELSISYEEETGNKTTINFGSKDEMIAVANAMLKLAYQLEF